SRTWRDLVAALCCRPVAETFDFTDTRAVELTPPERAAPAGVRAEAARAEVHPFTELLTESLAGGPKASAATLVLAAMGVRNADDSALASDPAPAHPGEAILVQQILGPALAPYLPLAGGVQRGADAGTLDALAKEVAALKETVEKQKEDIA